MRFFFFLAVLTDSSQSSFLCDHVPRGVVSEAVGAYLWSRSAFRPPDIVWFPVGVLLDVVALVPSCVQACAV